jgi:hypothetical protein
MRKEEMKLSEGEIAIISGEGEIGSAVIYRGKRTQRALRARLTRERCNGDRWARAVQYTHTNDWGDWGRDLETDAPCAFPVID